MMKRISLSLQTIARYILGAGIIPYALSKLLDFQFQVSAWNYSLPLGRSSKTNAGGWLATLQRSSSQR